MTSILKDSLGGNSLTSMIATCSLEESNLGETISTCRFAQRVALIKNEVVRNEALNPLVEIELLKKELQDLKANYALLAGSDEPLPENLTEEEIDKCQSIVKNFVSNTDLNELQLPNLDIRKIQLCFRLLRSMVVQAQDSVGSRGPSKTSSNNDFRLKEMQSKLDEVRKTLKQRDKEMSVLCRLLKQEKQRIDSLLKCQAQFLDASPSSPNSQPEKKSEVLGGEVQQPRAIATLPYGSTGSNVNTLSKGAQITCELNMQTGQPHFPQSKPISARASSPHFSHPFRRTPRLISRSAY